ncbi:phospholipase D-like domain-containing protein [Phytoactinopolyspora limicola]|uniref:phospholipase D-like domain-containing protein n=1 Tax=Phytoactinopolyspora limicola TaxID=2715536 RepID=UPI00140A295D|nr:phospholipase D-like domain-containing protein [Phytoactinopolyspora limicola]
MVTRSRRGVVLSGLLAVMMVASIGLTHAQATTDVPATPHAPPAAAEPDLAAELAAAPRTGALFNNPQGTKAQQYVIRNYLLEMVKAAKPGSTISMSIFNITNFDRGFADALVQAARRGVKVRVVLEGTAAAKTGAGKAIIAGLGTNKSRSSWAVVCTKGCHGTKINHNKFYLFSSVSGRSNVVVQSSANLTVANGRRFWNNAVTFVGNKTLYNAYLTYFNDLSRNRTSTGYYRTVLAGNVKTYHFPRRGTNRSTDTVYQALGNVGCTGNTTVGTASGKTIIRIAIWHVSRVAIADRLVSLAKKGCKINIAYTHMGSEAFKKLKGQKNIQLRQLADNGKRDIVHSKYLLIAGKYAGKKDRKVTFTGSPNWGKAALRSNDETMLRIISAPIHDQYKANFKRVMARGVKR